MRCFREDSGYLFGRRSLRVGASISALLVMGAWTITAMATVQTSAQPTDPSGPQDVAASRAVQTRSVLDRYCVTCHNQKLQTSGLALDTLDVTKPGIRADVWERVIGKLRMGSMPPIGRPRPDKATYRDVASWLETELDRAAATPNPGRTGAVHRLTRTEYRNAIRDLLALDIDVASLLPGDQTSDSGFDNNADVLSMTTAQLERYMSVARRVSRLAIGLASTGGYELFDVPLLLVQDDRRSEDLPLGSQGGTAIRYTFPADGEYLIKLRLRANRSEYIRGMGSPHELDVRIDGALVKRFTVGGEAEGRPAPLTYTFTDLGDPRWELYLRNADDGLEVRVHVDAGPHVVGASFVRSLWEHEGILQPQLSGRFLSQEDAYHGNAELDSVAIGGPYEITGPGDTPSRQQIFVCQPRRVSEQEACATRILSRLARRAYRRPVTAGEVQALLGVFKTGRSDGSFDAGIQLALERLLVDPNFLVRVEPDPADVTPGQVYRLSDGQLASRVSFFLWSSIPDDPLLDLAERGRLRESQTLEQQVRRMLADPRSQALVDNFAAQWLHLRNIADLVGDATEFPDFDDNLVEAFKRETELFIGSTLAEDRSVLDLLRADYTFVNERLARHYGIPGIYGNRFRRVRLPNMQQRGGLLGQGGILALTSYPTRTSPVLRGKWLLDTIVGAPPPSPPSNVPPLPESGEGGKRVSVRERLEQHRKNPVCASCHANIDPPGIALEGFDATGAWRTVDEGGKPIDAAGTLASGENVEGLPGLRAALVSQPEQVVRNVTQKLLQYALGRGLEAYDQPTVRKIVRDAAARDYRWSSLIRGVVKSPAFLMRRSQEAEQIGNRTEDGAMRVLR